MSLSQPWMRRLTLLGVPALVVTLIVAACGGGGGAEPEPEPDPEPEPQAQEFAKDTQLVVYSGRSKTLVEPVIDAFAKATGIKVGVKYAGTSEIVATVLEEGKNSPADVVFLQDEGALGALSAAGVLRPLPDALLNRVDKRFRSRQGEWVGTSGRARTVAYNTARIDAARDLPPSILGFTDPGWKGRIGWAPTNGSFQAFVTALRVQLGQEQARRWLEGIKANSPKAYANNTAIVAAVAAGEVDVGFVNHYYLHRFLKEQGEGFGARNYYFTGGDPGALVLVSGVGILETAKHRDAAQRFVDYLLGKEAQEYFSRETFEYPLVPGIASVAGVPPMETLDPPDIDLSALEDLRGTLDLLREAGILG